MWFNSGNIISVLPAPVTAHSKTYPARLLRVAEPKSASAAAARLALRRARAPTGSDRPPVENPGRATRMLRRVRARLKRCASQQQRTGTAAPQREASLAVGARRRDRTQRRARCCSTLPHLRRQRVRLAGAPSHARRRCAVRPYPGRQRYLAARAGARAAQPRARQRQAAGRCPPAAPVPRPPAIGGRNCSASRAAPRSS